MAKVATYSTALDATIQHELEAQQAQVSALIEGGRSRSQAARAQQERESAAAEKAGGSILREPLPPWILTAEEQTTIDALQARSTHLEQISKLFKDDPELMRLVDQTIGHQVSTAQRRQLTFSALFAVLSLVAGWLLSALSPALAFSHLIGH